MTELYKKLAVSQMIAALRTLDQAIESCDQKTWTADHLDTAVNQVVFHTLFYTDLYLNPGVTGFRDQSFHRDHQKQFDDYEELEETRPTHVYERDFCTAYMEFCVQKARSVIAAETQEILEGKSGFDWRPCSRAELHVYNTRHIQHHAAQLGLRNQLAGGGPLEWVGEG